MKLIPGAYAGAHLRALYNRPDRAAINTLRWAQNAVNCASQMRPGFPIFFASDSTEATKYAELYAREKNAQIGTRTPNPNPSLHLDKATNWRSRPASDFYGTCLYFWCCLVCFMDVFACNQLNMYRKIPTLFKKIHLSIFTCWL
jgi:hypothetical protein